MKENKEDRVRKSLVSQIRISGSIRDSKDHRVLFSLQHRDQLRLPVVRLFYRHRQLLVHQEVLQGDRFLLFAHIVGGDIEESVRATPTVSQNREPKPFLDAKRKKWCSSSQPKQELKFGC